MFFVFFFFSFPKRQTLVAPRRFYRKIPTRYRGQGSSAAAATAATAASSTAAVAARRDVDGWEGRRRGTAGGRCGPDRPTARASERARASKRLHGPRSDGHKRFAPSASDRRLERTRPVTFHASRPSVRPSERPTGRPSHRPQQQQRKRAAGVPSRRRRPSERVSVEPPESRCRPSKRVRRASACAENRVTGPADTTTLCIDPVRPFFLVGSRPPRRRSP